MQALIPSPSFPTIMPDLELSLEAQLLLYLSRPDIDDFTAAHIRNLLEKGIDWSSLMAQANHHWVTMQIYPHLKQFGQPSIPSDLLTQVDASFFANTARNLLMATELLDLLKLFTDHGILAVPFKGATLAVSAYGNLARRKFSDLDILVAPADFHKALALLVEQADYRKLPTTFSLYPHEYPLVSREGDVFVDLHQQIAGRDFFTFPLSFEELTQRLQEMTLLDTTIPCFHPEDTILILCVHGSKHCWDHLGWICDFAAYVHAQPELDWNNIRQRAKVLGCDRMLYLALSLSQDLLGLPFPEQATLHLEAPTALASIKNQIYQRCFSATHPSAPTRTWSNPVLQLHILGRWQDRILYLLWFVQKILTPTYKDVAQSPLSEKFHFLNYLLRPLRLAGLWTSKP